MNTEQRLESIEKSLADLHTVIKNKLWPVDNPAINRQPPAFVTNEPGNGIMYQKVPKGWLEDLPGNKDVAEKALKPLIRDWEVLEFRSTVDKSQWTLIDGRYIGSVSQFRHTIDEMLSGFRSVEDGSIRINSVRRTTDGQVFTVGEVGHIVNSSQCSLIKAFRVEGNQMVVDMADFSASLYSLRAVIKPIFRTADGVAIHHDSEEVYCFEPGGRITTNRVDNIDVAYEYGHYSSRAAAETAYKNWLQSQRVLTLGDVLSCDGDIAKLEEIVKTRL